MAICVKSRPDGNLEKHLAELEKHPALRDRCEKIWLARIVQRMSYPQLAKTFGIHHETARRYCFAYEKILATYPSEFDVSHAMAFCNYAITRLQQDRKEAETLRDKVLVDRAIREYLDMANELAGLVDKRPQVQVNAIILNQVVDRVDEAVRGAMRKKGLDEALITEILQIAGEGIVDKELVGELA